MGLKSSALRTVLTQEYKPTIHTPDASMLYKNIKGMLEVHQKMHKDTWIICVGMPGTGKSNLAINIWLKLKELQGHTSNIVSDTIETYEDLLLFLKSTQNMPGKEALVDEMSVFANARKSMNGDSRDLNEVMDVIRIQQKRIILSGSSLKKVDQSVKERADCLLRTYKDLRTGEYKFGFYSHSRVNFILNNPAAIASFIDPIQFFKVCRPDFYGSVDKIPDEIDNEYQAYKMRFQANFIDDKIKELQDRKTIKEHKIQRDLDKSDEYNIHSKKVRTSAKQSFQKLEREVNEAENTPGKSIFDLTPEEEEIFYSRKQTGRPSNEC